MTDADLARWEYDCEHTLAGMAEYDSADVILPLIAEVRRLRAEIERRDDLEMKLHD